MALTNAQRNALHTAIFAETDPTFVGYRNDGNTGLMAQWYNGTLTPNVLAWRTAVTPQESDEAPSYSTFDSILAGKRDSWAFFLNYSRNYSKAKVRNWVVDVWGTATVGSNAEAILQAGTRNITRAENVLGGTTTATTGTVTGRRLTWEGPLSNDDVVQAFFN